MNNIIDDNSNPYYSVKIGNSTVAYTPETKRAIDIELLLLHLPLFAIIIAYGSDYVPWQLFLLLFYTIAMRIFIGNHDRYHSDYSVRLPRFLEIFSEGLGVVVTPWDEPYDSIRKKHLTHHGTHTPGKSPKYDPKNDPNSVYELGGFVRVFFSCLFYEEVQLYLDIRNKNLSKSRLYRFFIYVPLQIAFVLTFGWEKYLVVLLAMRLVGFTAWFVFSWVIHQPLVYKFGFSKQVPVLFKWIFALLHGNRVTEGTIHHASHHAWPSIPYNQLKKVDLAVMQNLGATPDMKPIGD